MTTNIRWICCITALLAPIRLQAQTTTWTEVLGAPVANSPSVWGASLDRIYLAGGYRGLARWDGASFDAMSHPAGANRYQVFGLAWDDVYSAGQSGYMSGSLLHYDGSAWSTLFTTSDELFASWGTSAANLWVVGDGTLRHWDGAVLTDVPTGLDTCFQCDRLTGLWGSGDGALYAVGWNGHILAWDGVTVHPLLISGQPDLVAVHGSAWNDVWAVGEHGTVLHFDGTSWSQVAVPTTVQLLGVFAYGPDDVYVSGDLGLLMHWDGVAWTLFDTGGEAWLSSIWGIDDGTVVVGVDRYRDPGTPQGLLIGTRATETSVAPEPGSAVLLLSGLVVLARGLRRT